MSVFKRQQQGHPKDIPTIQLQDYMTMELTLTDKNTNQRIDDMHQEVDQRFEASQTAMQTALTAQKTATDAALAAADRAVNKAEIAAEKRFEGVNEFRAALQDQQRTLMPRAEAEILFKQLTEKIDANTHALLTAAGQETGLKDGWLYLVGAMSVVSLFTSIILHFVK